MAMEELKCLNVDKEKEEFREKFINSNYNEVKFAREDQKIILTRLDAKFSFYVMEMMNDSKKVELIYETASKLPNQRVKNGICNFVDKIKSESNYKPTPDECDDFMINFELIESKLMEKFYAENLLREEEEALERRRKIEEVHEILGGRK